MPALLPSLLIPTSQGLPAALKRAKREFLAAAGVLQVAAPEATQFVLLAREPLPDELLTAVQVGAAGQTGASEGGGGSA